MSPLTEKFTGKYLKKLVGRTDLEDALKKLDELTNEEAWMATVQVPKATHTVENKVLDVKLDVDNRVVGVDDRVAGVDNRVDGIERRVASVDDKVKAIDDKVVEVMDGA